MDWFPFPLEEQTRRLYIYFRYKTLLAVRLVAKLQTFYKDDLNLYYQFLLALKRSVGGFHQNTKSLHNFPSFLAVNCRVL